MATPLTTRDENGINGRDWMDRAKEAVIDISYMRNNPEHRSKHHPTVESYREIARHAIADAWQHPEAAKAMQAVGLSERGMQDDLNAGKVAKVTEGLSAPDPAVVERRQDAVQVRREAVRQAAADYRIGLMAAAPARSEAPALAETQARRAVQRV